MSVVIGGPLGLGLVSATRSYRNIAGDHLSQNLHHARGQHPYLRRETLWVIHETRFSQPAEQSRLTKNS